MRFHDDLPPPILTSVYAMGITSFQSRPTKIPNP
jgi:hypothetical protein